MDVIILGNVLCLWVHGFATSFWFGYFDGLNGTPPPPPPQKQQLA
jgi:hypothetical protein